MISGKEIDIDVRVNRLRDKGKIDFLRNLSLAHPSRLNSIPDFFIPTVNRYMRTAVCFCN